MAHVALYRETYRLLVGAGSPLAARHSVTWQEAAAEPLCLLTGDMQNRRIINQHLGQAGAAANPRVESNSTIALVAHVASGGWASIVSDALASQFQGSGLAAIPMTEPVASHLVGLIVAHREPHTPVVTALMDEASRLSGIDS